MRQQATFFTRTGKDEKETTRGKGGGGVAEEGREDRAAAAQQVPQRQKLNTNCNIEGK